MSYNQNLILAVCMNVWNKRLNKLRYALLAVVAFVLPICANAASYTANVYVPKVGNPDYWNFKAAFLTENQKDAEPDWSSAQTVDSAGSISVDGIDYAVYSVTFDSDQQPSYIRFNVVDKNTNSSTHQDLKSGTFIFIDGALYNFDASAETPPADFDESMVNHDPQPNHTIYFADVLSWNTSGIRVHGWGNNGDLNLWDNNEYVTETGKLIKSGDKYYSLYKYSYIYYNGDLANIIFRTTSNQTVDINYPGDDKVVYLTGALKAGKYQAESMDMPETLYDATSHTVYFADRYGWGDTEPEKYIHAQVFLGKENNKDIVNGYWNNPNQLMTKTGKYVKIGDTDADYFPVYAYTFLSAPQPTEVHFYSSKTNPIIETQRYEFVDDAIYYMTSDAERCELAIATGSLVDEAKVPEMEHTVYFADWNKRGSANTKVHVWNGVEAINDGAMADYAYIFQNDTYIPVYQYTFKFKGSPAKIQFYQGSNYTGDMIFIDNGFYPNGDSIENQELIFAEECNVYFADKFGWGGGTRLTVVGDNLDFNRNLTNQSMTFTDKYVKLGEGDSDYYPLFKYTFTYLGDVEDLYFYYRENGFPNEDANKAQFVNDHMYYATAEGTNQDLDHVYAESLRQFSFNELPEVEHTVYFIDRTKYGAERTRVHVWNGGDAVKDWNSDDYMERYGLTSIEGQLYPVYVYNFKWRGAPTKLLFRLASQTTNLHYYEGYYYTNDGSAVENVEIQESPKFTVYFLDKNVWGADKTKVHVYGDAGDLLGWWDNEAMEHTGLYLKSGENDTDYYPLYKYEFRYDGNPEHLIFHLGQTQTQSLDFEDGKTYFFNTQGADCGIGQYDDLEKVTIDEIPSLDYTVYFLDVENMGAANVKPHVWGSTGDLFDWDHTESMKPLGTATVEDVKYTVYQYDFSYKGNPTNIIFKYPGNKNSQDWVFFNNHYYNKQGQHFADVDVEEFPTITVYFADKYNWGAEKTLVHVYGTKGYELSGWWDNDHMTDTGSYVEIDQWGYPLYSFTFRWEHETVPDRIIFHTDGAEGWNALLENGKLYAYSGYDKDQNHPTEVFDLGDQLTYEEVFEKYGTTIYYADTDRWGASHTGVHLYNEGTLRVDGTRDNLPEFAWGNSPRMTPTGKWVRINDVWAPVYVYSTIFKDAWGMNFHAFDDPGEDGTTSTLYRQTGDCIIEPDAIYYYAGYNIQVKPKRMSELTLYDKIPEEGDEGYVKEGRWIYCHLGANQRYEAAYWNEPHAHFVDRPYDVTLLKNHLWYESQLPDWRKADEAAAYAADKMEEVKGMPSVYRIWCDDINKVNEVVFYHFVESRNHTTNQKYEHYLLRPYDMAEHPISIDQAMNDIQNDPTTWASNAFTVGIHCMQQSYLTTEEYLESWTASPEALYVIGNKGFRPEYNDFSNFCDPTERLPIEADEDVYIVPIGTVSADEVVKFKLSLYDVKSVSAEKCNQQGISYSSNRGWATYNMGVLGHDFPDDDLQSEWYKSHIWEQAGMSREVKTFVNQTVRFNNYNQYGWRIEAGTGGVIAGQEYWLVVDLHSDDVRHRSVTLLAFDPQPTLEISSGIIEQRPISLEEAQMLHDPSLLRGTSANGPVYFDKVNVYTISGQLNEVGTDLLKPSTVVEEVEDEEGNITTEERTIPAVYDVEYFVYLIYDDMQIPVCKLTDIPEDGHVDITNLVYSPNVSYAIRAVYHDNEQNRHFCSRFMPVTTTPVIPDLLAPQVKDVAGTIYHYDGKLIGEEGVEAIGGAVNFDYPVISNEDGTPIPYAYFPDLLMTDLKVNGQYASANAQLIHADHHIVEQHGDYLGLSNDDDSTPWIPYVDGADYMTHHNWSNVIFNKHTVPLFIDRFDTTGVGTKSTSAEAKVEFAAVYPFLIHDISREAAADPFLARRSAAPSNSSDDEQTGSVEPLNSGAYTIFEVRKPSVASATFDGTVTISAIDNVSMDNAADVDAPVEYFTVSGQLLPAAPTTPGIYLRRQGTRVAKIHIK